MSEKKILILSEQDDVSTHNVVEWLKFFNASYVRMNSENDFDFHLKIQNGTKIIAIKCNDLVLSLDDIGVVWFRRGWISIPFSKANPDDVFAPFSSQIDRHLKAERSTIIDFIYYALKKKPHINFPHLYNINKLFVLSEAQDIGLIVPNTLVTKDNIDIFKFIKSHKQTITKCIQDSMFVKINNQDIMLNSTSLISNNVNNDDFIKLYYSLFQDYIEKKYELRIFFLFDKIFPCAIFPWDKIEADGKTLEKETVIGYERKRICPVQIPSEIKNKLILLMKQLQLESGSIDMIVTPNNEYVFLEVNPVGQFDYVSKLCNYFIEKEIAVKLIEMNKYEN